MQSYQTSWDFYPDTRHGLEDISLEKVNKFIEISNRIRLYPILDDPLTVLKKFELLKEASITNGCHLLFATEDILLSTIEIGRFSSAILRTIGAWQLRFSDSKQTNRNSFQGSGHY